MGQEPSQVPHKASLHLQAPQPPPTPHLARPTARLLLPAFPQETEIAPVIAPYWERAEFPYELVPGFQVGWADG